ncbi:MAG: hypothetical protein U0746_20655 [Gemmataceae bacterium]
MNSRCVSMCIRLVLVIASCFSEVGCGPSKTELAQNSTIGPSEQTGSNSDISGKPAERSLKAVDGVFVLKDINTVKEAEDLFMETYTYSLGASPTHRYFISGRSEDVFRIDRKVLDDEAFETMKAAKNSQKKKRSIVQRPHVIPSQQFLDWYKSSGIVPVDGDYMR